MTLRNKRRQNERSRDREEKKQEETMKATLASLARISWANQVEAT